jgi:hypothetical protein
MSPYFDSGSRRAKSERIAGSRGGEVAPCGKARVRANGRPLSIPPNLNLAFIHHKGGGTRSAPGGLTGCTPNIPTGERSAGRSLPRCVRSHALRWARHGALVPGGGDQFCDPESRCGSAAPASAAGRVAPPNAACSHPQSPIMALRRAPRPTLPQLPRR